MSEGTAERLLPLCKAAEYGLYLGSRGGYCTESTLAHGLKCRWCANGGGGNGRGMRITRSYGLRRTEESCA